MGDSIWEATTKIDKIYAEKYDACVDPDRRAAIVFSIIFNIHDDGEFDIVQRSGDVLIKDIPRSNDRDKGVPNVEMGQWIPSIKNVEQVCILDLKDEDKNFS